MFLLIVSTINVFFTVCYVLSFSISLEDVKYNDDTAQMATTKLTTDEHAIQERTIRTYLIFGYLVLLLIVVYVCYTTSKKQPKDNPVSCSD